MNKYQQSLINSVNTIVDAKMKKEGMSYYFNAKVVDHNFDDTYTVANTPHLCTYKEKQNCANCPYGFNSKKSLANHDEQIKRIKDNDNVCIGYFTCIYYELKARSGLVPSTGQVAQVLVKNGDFSTKVIDDILNGVGTVSGGGVNKVSLYPPLSLELSVDNVGYNDATLSWNTPSQERTTLGGYTLVFGQGSTPPYPSYHITVDIDKQFNSNTITKLSEGTTYTAWILARDLYGNFIQSNNYESIQTFTTPIRPIGSGSGTPSGGNPNHTIHGTQIGDGDYMFKEVLLPEDFTITKYTKVRIDENNNMYLSQGYNAYYYDLKADKFTKIVNEDDISDDMFVLNIASDNSKALVRKSDYDYVEFKDGIQVYSYSAPHNGLLLNSYNVDKHGHRFAFFQNDGESTEGVYNADTNVQILHKGSNNYFWSSDTDATGESIISSAYWDEDGSLNGIFRYDGSTFTSVGGGNGAKWNKYFEDSEGNCYFTHNEYNYDENMSEPEFANDEIVKGVWISRPNGTYKWYTIPNSYRLYNWIETDTGLIFCSSSLSKSLGLWLYDKTSDSFKKIYNSGNTWTNGCSYIDNEGNEIAILATANPSFDNSLTILKYNATNGSIAPFTIETSNQYTGVEKIINLDNDTVRIVMDNEGMQYDYNKLNGEIVEAIGVKGGYNLGELFFSGEDSCLYDLTQSYNYDATYPTSQSETNIRNTKYVSTMISKPNSEGRLTMLIVCPKF